MMTAQDAVEACRRRTDDTPVWPVRRLLCHVQTDDSMFFMAKPLVHGLHVRISWQRGADRDSWSWHTQRRSYELGAAEPHHGLPAQFGLFITTKLARDCSALPSLDMYGIWDEHQLHVYCAYVREENKWVVHTSPLCELLTALQPDDDIVFPLFAKEQSRRSRVVSGKCGAWPEKCDADYLFMPVFMPETTNVLSLSFRARPQNKLLAGPFDKYAGGLWSMVRAVVTDTRLSNGVATFHTTKNAKNEATAFGRHVMNNIFGDAVNLHANAVLYDHVIKVAALWYMQNIVRPRVQPPRQSVRERQAENARVRAVITDALCVRVHDSQRDASPFRPYRRNMFVRHVVDAVLAEGDAAELSKLTSKLRQHACRRWYAVCIER